MLPRRAFQSGSQDLRTLSMELLLVFDQQIRKLSGTDAHSNGLQELEDFRFTHPTRVVESQHPSSHSWSKLAFVTARHFCQIGLLLAGRGVFLFPKLDILRAKLNVLDDDFLVALELCILRQSLVIQLHYARLGLS